VKRLVLAGHHFGWQSVRNPSLRAYPVPRPAVNGYLWGYVHGYGDTGWMKETALTKLNLGDGPRLNGPAGQDFQVGVSMPTPKKKPRWRIGRAIRGRRVVTSRELYIRYSPRGTAFGYLLEGDVVEVRWLGLRGFACVTVVKSDSVEEGSTGWVWLMGTRKQR
jgi:hypothetical protein